MSVKAASSFLDLNKAYNILFEGIIPISVEVKPQSSEAGPVPHTSSGEDDRAPAHPNAKKKDKKAPASLSPEILEAKRARKISDLLENDQSKLDSLKEYVAEYCGPEKYQELFKEEPTIVLKNLDTEIEHAFQEANEEYKYFPNDQVPANFVKLYKLFKYRQATIDPTLTDELLIEGAYKSMVFFDNDEKLIKNLSNFIDSNVKTASPIHDIAIINTPVWNEKNPQYPLDEWRKLTQTAAKEGTGLEVLRSFQNGPDLATGLQKHNLKNPENPKNFPKTQTELLKLLSELQYENPERHPVLAAIYAKYKIPSYRFETSLKFLEKLPQKTVDEIPDIVVQCDLQGRNVKTGDMAKGPGYYMVKLPSSDPRCLILGDITGCCQSFDNHGIRCVKDGISLPDNGFYLYLKAKDPTFDPKKIDWVNLEKSADIVGQSYVWNSLEGNFTLDSLEISNSVRKDLPYNSLLTAFSEAICAAKDTINRVTVGAGGGTEDVREVLPHFSNEEDSKQEILLGKAVLAAELMKTGIMYGDAEDQIALYETPKLKIMREEAKQIFGRKIFISSENQLIILKKMPPEMIQQLSACDDPEHILRLSHLYDTDILSITPLEKREILINKNTMKCCTSGKGPKFSELLTLSAEEIIDATSGMRAFYEAENGPSYDEIKTCEPQKLPYLTSEEALECYAAAKGPKFTELATLPLDRIVVLVNYNTGAFYAAAKGPSFEDLKDLPEDRVLALTEGNMQACYNATKGPKFSDLLGVDIEKIQALTSVYALGCYAAAKGPSFEDLKDLPVDKVLALTKGNDAFNGAFMDEAYNTTNGPSFSDLAILYDKGETQRINLLTRYDALLCYRNPKGPKFSDLLSVDIEKIRVLTSQYTLRYYEAAKGPSLQDLKDLPVDKVLALTKGNMYELYNTTNGPSFSDFAILYDRGETQRINLMTGYDALLCYQNPKGPKFSDLLGMDIEKIKVLTRYHYRAEKGPSFKELADLYDSGQVAKINALVYEKQIGGSYSYPKALSFKELSDLYDSGQVAKIKFLPIGTIQEVCSLEKGPNLKELTILYDKGDLERIKLLTSYEAIKCYKTAEGPRFSDLKDLPIEKIKAFTSLTASEFYYRGLSFNKLSAIDDPAKIQALLTSDASSLLSSLLKPAAAAAAPTTWVNRIGDAAKSPAAAAVTTQRPAAQRW